MDLTPVSQFDEVYQLEKTDPVLGGPGGISNRQAQNLANRTQWLKDAIDALEGGGGPFDYNASGGLVPTHTTNTEGGSGSGGAIVRKDQFVVSVAGVVSGTPLQVGDSLIAKQDDPTLITHYVVIQGNAELATQTVLGLVKLSQDLSPGNVADAVLSLAGLIGIFAQLNSPLLTGNPKAPTKAQTDKTTNIATNEYVAQAIVDEAGVRTNGDASNAAAINNEITARQGAITGEATARSTADGILQTQITAEVTNRQNADTAEATARSNADATLQTNINAIDDSNTPWGDPGFVYGAGMSSGSATIALQARKVRGVVQLRGYIQHAVPSAINSGDVILTLPVGYRPVGNRSIRVNVGPQSIVGGTQFVDIAFTGTVALWEMGKTAGSPMDNNSCWLDNIQFDAVH
jgi:hypothetical protein